jgi:hypothetical protein
MEDRYRYAFSEQLQRPGNGPSTASRAGYPSNQNHDFFEEGSNVTPQEIVHVAVDDCGNLSDLPNYRVSNARTHAKYIFDGPSELNGGTVGESSHSFVHQPSHHNQPVYVPN